MGDQDVTPPEPLRRRRRNSLSVVLDKVPAVWKLVGAVLGLVGLGAGGYAYAEKFATQADVVELGRDLRQEIKELRENGAGRSLEVAVVRAEVAAMRAAIEETSEDVRTILGYILENPPRRGRGR